MNKEETAIKFIICILYYYKKYIIVVKSTNRRLILISSLNNSYWLKYKISKQVLFQPHDCYPLVVETDRDAWEFQ